MISHVSELLNFIAYMTTSMLLVDMIPGELLDLDMPP